MVPFSRTNIPVSTLCYSFQNIGSVSDKWHGTEFVHDNIYLMYKWPNSPKEHIQCQGICFIGTRGTDWHLAPSVIRSLLTDAIYREQRKLRCAASSPGLLPGSFLYNQSYFRHQNVIFLQIVLEYMQGIHQCTQAHTIVRI